MVKSNENTQYSNEPYLLSGLGKHHFKNELNRFQKKRRCSMDLAKERVEKQMLK